METRIFTFPRNLWVELHSFWLRLISSGCIFWVFLAPFFLHISSEYDTPQRGPPRVDMLTQESATLRMLCPESINHWGTPAGPEEPLGQLHTARNRVRRIARLHWELRPDLTVREGST